VQIDAFAYGASALFANKVHLNLRTPGQMQPAQKSLMTERMARSPMCSVISPSPLKYILLDVLRNVTGNRMNSNTWPFTQQSVGT